MMIILPPLKKKPPKTVTEREGKQRRIRTQIEVRERELRLFERRSKSFF